MPEDTPEVKEEEKIEIRNKVAGNPNDVEITNQMLENYFASTAISNIRNSKSPSAANKHKIFQVTLLLSDSPEAKAYAETKKDLFDREGEVPSDPDDAEKVQYQKVINRKNNPEAYEELMELTEQNSGIVVTKPLLPMDDFEGCSEADFSGSAWIFDWRQTAKEIREIENPKKNPKTD